MDFIVTDLIRKKRFGGELEHEEIQFLLQEYVAENIPDYQMSALLMAICFQGMTVKETAKYTELIQASGSSLNFSTLHPYVVDKHSTGGVGDKTSLMLAPIVAAAGIHVPMIAGRGLGHTGGTLDKLESIPGFNVNLTLQQFQKNVCDRGFSIIGQTQEICPADKKLYALRDVTGTIDSLPLICGSIMSKKLAEGLSSLVLDVKFGSGAFMKTESDAVKLAQLLQSTGRHNGVNVHALITSMEEPLGAYIGNSLEVHECLEIMKGHTLNKNGVDFYSDTRDLTLRLAGEMIFLGKKASSPEDGLQMAEDILSSGKALKNFIAMVEFQGGKLPKTKPSVNDVYVISSGSDGYIQAMDVEQLGMASLLLGAGRQQASDPVDPNVGIEMHVKISNEVKKGDPLCTIYSNGLEDKHMLTEKIQNSISIGPKKPPAPILIKQILR